MDARAFGTSDPSACPRCGSRGGRKLGRSQLIHVATAFFVWGSEYRRDYGAIPKIQFNDLRKTDIRLPGSLRSDARVFEDILGIGFFRYEPRSWMFGEIEPLKDLQCNRTRSVVIERILHEYESRTLTVNDKFYRIRKNPEESSNCEQYDSPPAKLSGGRLGTEDWPVLYVSPDISTCLHECRVTAEDNLFMATLRPTSNIKLLDVSTILVEPRGVTEFESLDLAVMMLFLAGEKSYQISRDLSRAAGSFGFDGIVYPSYFSMLRSGMKPFETTYGRSHRRIPQYRKFEESKMSANFAIFGRPIERGLIEVCCINRLVLTKVTYQAHFGPAMS